MNIIIIPEANTKIKINDNILEITILYRIIIIVKLMTRIIMAVHRRLEIFIIKIDRIITRLSIFHN